MKKLLITLFFVAGAWVSAHAQDTTLRYLHRGSQGVWVDEAIIGQANYAGAEGARRQMACTRSQAPIRAAAGHNTFIRFDFLEAAYYRKAKELYPDNSLVATMWYTTAWNAFVYTIEADTDFVRWYRSLPGHSSFAIDNGSGW